MVQKQKWSQLDGAHIECGYDSDMAFSFVYIYDEQTTGPKWSTVDGIYYTHGTQ